MATLFLVEAVSPAPLTRWTVATMIIYAYGLVESGVLWLSSRILELQRQHLDVFAEHLKDDHVASLPGRREG
jgi:hypothetical protein